MDVTCVDDARRWTREWEFAGGISRGLLAACIAGQRICVAIERGAPHRYSLERLADTEAVLAYLADYSLRLFGPRVV